MHFSFTKLYKNNKYLPKRKNTIKMAILSLLLDANKFFRDAKGKDTW